MPNEIKPIILPLFSDTARHETGESALVDFIYEFTPLTEEDNFRDKLQLALEEVVKEQTAQLQTELENERTENARLQESFAEFENSTANIIKFQQLGIETLNAKLCELGYELQANGDWKELEKEIEGK